MAVTKAEISVLITHAGAMCRSFRPHLPLRRLTTLPMDGAMENRLSGLQHTMLLMLLRFMAHTEETEPELEHLSRATLRLMATVLRPLGEALARRHPQPHQKTGRRRAAVAAGASRLTTP